MVVSVLGKVSAAAAGTRAAAETVLNASNSVDASVGDLRAEIEGFLNKVAVLTSAPFTDIVRRADRGDRLVHQADDRPVQHGGVVVAMNGERSD